MIIQPRLRNIIATVLVAVLLITSCASFEVIEPQEAVVQRKVEIGDTVRIVTEDDRKFKLRVSDITVEALIGEDRRTSEDRKVLFDEIHTLEKKVSQANVPHVLPMVGIILLLIAFKNCSECEIR